MVCVRMDLLQKTLPTAIILTNWKMKKSYQTNATTTNKMKGQNTDKKNNEGITRVWQKWRFSVPRTHLW
jgi:hypothetical protein